MRETGYSLVELANGTRSVRSATQAETFHPVIGPVAEAEALYVRQLRLRERIAAADGEFVVWDVGLGAAANPLTLLRCTRDLRCPVRLISFDQTLEPLRFALRHRLELGYFDSFEAPLTRLASGDGQTIEFSDGARRVSWELVLGDFPALLESTTIGGMPKPHAILFDPYSPASNPEMWTLPLFERLFGLLDPARPCALPTYSRSTLLRVTLLLAGFFVGRGGATGEKEETTVAANTPALIERLLDPPWLERARRSSSAEPLRQPVYRQERLSADSWARLQRHPQFAAAPSAGPSHGRPL
jgi:hypothetical protein